MGNEQRKIKLWKWNGIKEEERMVMYKNTRGEKRIGQNQIQTWRIMSICSLPTAANAAGRTRMNFIQSFIMCGAKLPRVYSACTPVKTGRMHKESGHVKARRIECDGGDDKWLLSASSAAAKS